MEDEKTKQSLRCKDCEAFEPNDNYPEGACHLNPPQVVVEDGEVYSVFPVVDGDTMRCLKLISRETPLVIPQKKE